MDRIAEKEIKKLINNHLKIVKMGPNSVTSQGINLAARKFDRIASRHNWRV